ncbi:hypothetical protein [Brevundimonas sp. PAMC22021]|uniref:hypothetical protein n=1 Tax=Brevundimonas sp. PAMC22021 TaxID=2861285 RepID=UPI001C6312F2|nr:hypothetical protein [Brevundimonas sp. PAMC22021]QYF86463.1 hypothetical protein KY493_11595 [Brevundimonas sp. PAMC22021]
MIRQWAAVAAFVTLGLAGCERTAERVQADLPTPPPTADSPVAAPTAQSASTTLSPAAPGAPGFAVLYPGAAVEEPATTAVGPDGEGGLVTFATDAAPDAVVAFYRQHAEAAGLTSVMGMNQGDARAYGAAGAQPDSASLQVVASPGEAGRTSVQLTWNAGR